MEFRDRWALITGASSGIGEEFARRLAERGMNLIVAARRIERLQSLADELTESHGVTVHPVGVDLLADGEPDGLLAEVEKLGHAIDLLVNNAGFGILSRVDETNVDEVLRMIDLNLTALTTMTYRLLPQMRQRSEGAIVNLASLAAFQPVVYMPAYGATKTFVLHFSEALWAELRDTGVQVLALCPGFTRTEFFDVAGMQGWYTWFAQTPTDVVNTALKTLRKRRSNVVVGWMNWVISLMPRLSSRRMNVLMSERFMRPRDEDSEAEQDSAGPARPE